MSRVGKQPVEIPSGVKASVNGQTVQIEGPKGKLVYDVHHTIVVKQEENSLVVEPINTADRQAKASFGSTRSHLANMVKGVTEGWQKSLELTGVGFNAKLQGNTLTLFTGYSHDVDIEVPQGVNCNVNKSIIDLDSADKELVGSLAARIKKVCPPEPYLGKGIKYVGEQIRRKAGKAGKK